MWPQRILLARSSLVLLVRLARSEVHSLFVANRLSPPNIHHIEFDDQTNSLALVKTMEADAGHIWITFSNDRKSIYGASKEAGIISSYDVSAEGQVNGTAVVKLAGACEGKTPAFAIASDRAPYFVFAGAYPGPDGCGTSISVNQDGALESVVDSWPYASDSGIHGLALSQQGNDRVLYAADITGNSIWTSMIDESGKASDGVRFELPDAEMSPRHVTVHPKGAYAYAIMEAGHSVREIKLDTSAVGFEVGGTDYLLGPKESTSESNSGYTGADIMVSGSGRYLWATSRARGGGATTGYLSCFLLDEDGAIVKLMFMAPTGTAGSISNAITAAPWSDEFAVLTDVPGGYVEVWKMNGRQEGDSGVEYGGVKVIARLEVGGRSCCANALWYN